MPAVRALLLAELWAASPAGAAGPASASQVGQAIALRRARVAELRLIKGAAEELGLRVWLFGGTAAGFAHYVRWDLEREAGDPRYRDAFFDYDFTNIYRSTQDADLVVDGTPAQAEQLENLVREKMAFLQGSKEHWEVRLLRQDRVAHGGQVKQALLANPDFLEQHTDSNSTGMIELTDPPGGETVVRDLRDWTSPEPVFLRDLAAGRLHYYWSETHGETSRAREGHNPPLFSVIRYLVKAFQYGLAIEGEDRVRIQRVIDDFDPRRDHAAMSQWARGWLERYGPNLIRHAVDIERAWNTLEELGLREKLIALSDPAKESSLGWWLSKEPLRTGAVGLGQGKTAAELGLTVVAHETNNFLSYESITRDMTGRPNVLISRQGFPGEGASEGPGFYTREGRTGAKGTGLTIRFRVDPAAREGTDFTLKHAGMVLFHNRAALQVIPESLEVSLLQYFELLRDGLVDPGDRGAWMKLRRRLLLRPLAEGDESRIVAMVSEEIKRLAASQRVEASPIFGEWLALPAAEAHPELFEELYRAVSRELEVGSMQRFAFYALLDREPGLSRRLSLDRPDLVKKFFDRYASRNFVHDGINHMGNLGDGVLANLMRHWSDPPDLVRYLIERKMFYSALKVLSRPQWSGHPELAREVIATLPGNYTTQLELTPFLRSPLFWSHPELLEALMDRGPKIQLSVHDALIAQLPMSQEHPEMILAMIDWLDSHPLRDRMGLGKPAWWASDNWIDDIIQNGGWYDNPRLRELCGGKAPHPGCLREALRRDRRVTEEVVEGVDALRGQEGLNSCSSADPSVSPAGPLTWKGE